RRAAIPSADHPYTQPSAAQMLHQPDHHGGLSGTAQGHVPYHDKRHGWLPAGGRVIQIALPFAHGDAAVQCRQGAQQHQPAALLVPGAQQPLLYVRRSLHGAGCSISLVVRRKRVKPCWPAASIAVMTAWWGVL